MVTTDVTVLAIADTTLRILIFAALAYANRHMLARHWHAFRRGGWRSIVLVVVGMIVVQLVISLARSAYFAIAGRPPETDSGNLTVQLAFIVLLVASLGPTVTSLIEDFTFRHTLLVRLPVWGNLVVGSVVVLLNALLFGLIHINNFGGNIWATLQYAPAGLVMNLVYLWTRNIWHVLLMHGLNNFLLAGPLIVILAQLLGGAS